MEPKKRKVLRLVLPIATLVVTIVGLVLAGLLSVLKDSEFPITFADRLNTTIEFFKNIASVDPSTISGYIVSMLIVTIFVVTFIVGLVYVIKLVVDLVRFNKEGSDKRIIVDSLKLSFTPLIFFGMLVFFSCFKEAGSSVTPDIGSYLCLGLGALGVCLTAFNYFLTSEKPTLNKILRVCLMVVGFAAAIILLMPTIVYEGLSTTPGFIFITLVLNTMGGSMSYEGMMLLIIATSMFALLVVAASLMNAVGCLGMDERVKKDAEKETKAKNVILIVLAAVSVVFAAGAFFGLPLINLSSTITLSLLSYVALALTGLALILAIVVVVLSKNEKEAESPQSSILMEELPGAEPEPEKEQAESEQETVEEAPKEEEKVEEAVAAAIIVDAATEEPESEVQEAEKEEEKVQEEPAEPTEPEEPNELESSEQPKEEKEPAEEKVEEKPAEEKKAPAKKPAAKKEPEKKAAPAKKPASKKEETKEVPKKNTASYHLSKRASDNKWQVFRAGSDKVIKLFDTKVEAEEYTKRMAENQGVSYLSHASKGKNKGRIQKK